MTLEAVYEGGMLRLMQPIDLPEGTRVEITLVKTIPSPFFCRLGGVKRNEHDFVGFRYAAPNLLMVLFLFG